MEDDDNVNTAVDSNGRMTVKGDKVSAGSNRSSEIRVITAA